MNSVLHKLSSAIGGIGRIFAVVLAMASVAMPSMAQRKTDSLNRGIVAIKKASGVFISWRVQADEYYDVTYNIYRDGAKINSQPLLASNFTDNSGSATSSYSVAAVINGVEQAQCEAVTPWNNGRVDKSSRVLFPCPAYHSVPMQPVKDRSGNDITANYSINDVVMADLDGDGELEFIVKRINDVDAANGFPTSCSYGFTVFEAYKWDGTRLWSIDVGPNMVSLNATETNIIAYDWDQDGKAEVLLRGADDMLLHKSNGQTQRIGVAGANTRDKLHYNGTQKFTNYGNEYLIYANGQTLEPYSVQAYPIARGNASDWGDTYGHRSSKYFMGAPYLDGRKPSIFLARGIYTKIEMRAYDVDPSSHNLTQRWSWSSGAHSESNIWSGQGNHNFEIADVDLDGCDEIIYGSMTIDNNGKGLSSTGLGHGDALHVGDLDPFRPGLEVFACNEDKGGNNYRNATTSEIYHRDASAGDDGRAMAGNFTDLYPGCQGASTTSGIISLSSDAAIAGVTNNWNGGTASPLALNFRIYWDGDLLEETINGPGSAEGELYIDKWGARIMQTVGAKCINDTKKNPNFSGDIIGDWREEMVLRSADNTELRVYSTTDETAYRIPCLWYDHQYRQGVTREALVYNQPPHVSYFVGAMEGLTVAPPPYTLSGRTEVSNGGVISSATNGKHVFIRNEGSYGIASDGIEPAVLFVNAPSVVAGTGNNSNISTSIKFIQLGANVDGQDTKGVIRGAARLVKQGEGVLKLTKKTHPYTGDTEIWGGEFNFYGTLSDSRVWMNRHTKISGSGTYNAGIVMEYGAVISIDNNTTNDYTGFGTITVSNLEMHEGARVIVEVSEDQCDKLNLGTLSLRTRQWEYGPQYLKPVLEVRASSLSDGQYEIGTLSNVVGSLDDIVIECSATSSSVKLAINDGKLYLKVGRQNIDTPEYKALVALVEKAQSVADADTRVWGSQLFENYPLYVKDDFDIALSDAKDLLVVANEDTDLSAVTAHLTGALLAYESATALGPVDGGRYMMKLSNADYYLDLSEGANNFIKVTAGGTVVTFVDAKSNRWYIQDGAGNGLVFPDHSQNWVLGTTSGDQEPWYIVSDGAGACVVNSYWLRNSGRGLGADRLVNKVPTDVTDGTHVDGRKDVNYTGLADQNGMYARWIISYVDVPHSEPVASSQYVELANLYLIASLAYEEDSRIWGNSVMMYPVMVKSDLYESLAAAKKALSSADNNTDLTVQINALSKSYEIFKNVSPVQPLSGGRYTVQLADSEYFLDLSDGANNKITVTSTGTTVILTQASDDNWIVSLASSGAALCYPQLKTATWVLGTTTTASDKATWSLASAGDGACYINSLAIPGRCLGADAVVKNANGKRESIPLVDGSNVDGRKNASATGLVDENGKYTRWILTCVEAPRPVPNSQQYKDLLALVTEAQELLDSDDKAWGNNLFCYSPDVKNDLQKEIPIAEAALALATDDSDLSAEISSISSAIENFKNAEPIMPISGAHYSVRLDGYDLYLDLSRGSENIISLSAAGTDVVLTDAGDGKWYLSDESGNNLYLPDRSKNYILGTSSVAKGTWTFSAAGDGLCYIYGEVNGRCLGADYKTAGVVGPVVGTNVDARKDAANRNRDDINGSYTKWVLTCVKEPDYIAMVGTVKYADVNSLYTALNSINTPVQVSILKDVELPASVVSLQADVDLRLNSNSLSANFNINDGVMLNISGSSESATLSGAVSGAGALALASCQVSVPQSVAITPHQLSLLADCRFSISGGVVDVGVLDVDAQATLVVNNSYKLSSSLRFDAYHGDANITVNRTLQRGRVYYIGSATTEGTVVEQVGNLQTYVPYTADFINTTKFDGSEIGGAFKAASGSGSVVMSQVGNPYTGDGVFSLAHKADCWNLIQNPYLFPISLDSSDAPSIEFGESVLPTVCVRGFNNTDKYHFITYNLGLNVSVAQVGSPSKSGDLEGATLAPQQAFYVMSVADDAQNFVKFNKYAVDDMTKLNVSKLKGVTVPDANVLRLSISDEDYSFADELAIVFRADGSLEQNRFDSPKKLNTTTLDYSQLFAVKQDGLNAAIALYPSVDAMQSQAIQLGMRASSKSGKLRISATNADFFDPSVKIILCDGQQQYDLRAADYVFDVEPGKSDLSRFSIMLMSGATTSVGSLTAEGVSVNAVGGSIVVECTKPADVAVYTIGGQCLMRFDAVGRKAVSVQPGLYFVTVTIDGQTWSLKLLL